MERSHTFYEDLEKKVRSGAVTDEEIRELFTRQNKRHENIISAIEGENAGGYPITSVYIMEHSELNRLAAENGMESPDYVSDYKEVYRRALLAMGVNWVDQWIPDNPLSMGAHGYEGSELGATTGGETLVLDGIPIEEPEDVVEHLEKCVFPWLRSMIENYDYEAKIREIGLNEYWAQMEMGEEMLKTGHATARFPQLDYFTYGYVNYFCAYVMYSDVIEESFKLQAELARKDNTAVVEAYKRYNLPKIIRLDHDMTDSRTTLVDIKSLERTWFPLADYSLKPFEGSDIRLIWHSDGNVMPMVPGLLDIGISGFQGFQYEDGVDFDHMCRLRDKWGRPMFLIAGSSVTRTLPMGTPEDVRAQIDYFVKNHGDTALALGFSSSMTPGVPPANLDAARERFLYYRNHIK